MKTGWILGSLFAIGCGGSNNNGIMTAEERLNQQVAIADAQKEERNENLGRYEESETDSEVASKFDKEAAKHELKRAALNAVDCPNTFDKAQLGNYQPGKATVTLTFENVGSVKNVMVSAPYDGTAVGDCVIRAMGTVRIDPYDDPEVTTTWELELLAPKVASKTTDTKKKK